MCKKIAITGGIGSGKSLVLQCIRELGYPAYSCDDIYKEISGDAQYIEKIKEFFPECIRNNIFDRKKLSDIVFNNRERLERLNQISHPLIMRELHERMNQSKAKLLFAEVPLLFEEGFEKDFDETIYVKRNLEKRIRAVILRDKTDRLSVIKRIQRQFDPDSAIGKEKLKSSNVHILENDADVENVKIWLNNFIVSISQS